MVLRALDLLTSTDEGEIVVPGLTLDASPDSVTVIGPTGQILGSWSWTEVTALGADGWAVGSDGRPHQILELAAGDRCHRLLASASDASILLAAAGPWRRMGFARTDGLADRRAHRPAHSRTAKRRGVGFLRLGRPRHARLLRLRPVAAGIGSVALIAVGATLGAVGTGGAQAANRPGAGGGVSIMSRMAQEFATRSVAAKLAPATTAPAPAPPSLAGSPALKSHEVFGFAPYWTLPQASGFDVSGLTTLAYFSVDVNADGTVQNSGPGWTGYESQDLADLITRAHAAGSRVVLTATCFGQSSLNALTSSPAAAKRLAATLVQLVSAKNLDGVNLDFEGEGSADQAGLDSLVAQVSAAMRQANSHWQVTMDTYASSAGDPGGFYDIAGLAPSVDAFFVMAYDMNGSSPSPTAALTGSGFTDLDALEQYTAVVPASKVILGVPYYGYDWPTTGPGLGAAATGNRTPMSDSQIVKANHPVYWDPATQTAWTSYQVGTQWHQTWFDDPTSLALKAQLANFFHIAGMGVWALGMDGNNPAMLAALLGDAPVVKDFLPGPGTTTTTVPGSSSTTTTTTAATPYSYSGVWNGSAVSLTPVVVTTLPDSGAGEPVGVLSAFSTDDPAVTCLATGGTLDVSELIAEPSVYVVTAPTPPDCAAGSWTFVVDGDAGGGGSGGGSPSTTTTTSTTAPTTTTTSTTSTTTTTEPTG